MKIKIDENSKTTIDKKVVGTQITLTMYEQLKKDAENDFMSISDLLRKIIYLYYRDKNEKENN